MSWPAAVCGVCAKEAGKAQRRGASKRETPERKSLSLVLSLHNTRLIAASVVCSSACKDASARRLREPQAMSHHYWQLLQLFATLHSYS